MAVENEKAKPFQIQGLWPHEILLLGLLFAALYGSQYQALRWPRHLYGVVVLLAFPVLWFRCREEWRRLPNRGFLLGLAAVWAALFAWLGISYFQFLGTRSLYVWMFSAYSSPLQDEQHGMLIPFVVLVLVWWKRRELVAQPLALWWPGLGLVAAGLFLHLAGFVTEQPRASVMGFFLGLYGLMGVAWGPRWLRAVFFPYFLLAFCVPVGELAIPLTLPLRILVATIVAWISHFGLAPDIIREGTQLFDAQHTYRYEVAPACSGIRSVVAMLALTIIYGHLCLKPVWKRLLLVASAIPLAVLGNVVRLCLTIMVAEMFGQDAGKACETNFGFVTFAVAIGCVLWLGRWLEASETKPAPKSPPRSS
jgi:exosortase